MISPVRSLAAAALSALLMVPALTGTANAAASKVFSAPMAKTEAEMKKVAQYWQPSRLAKADSYAPATPAGKAPASMSTAAGASAGPAVRAASTTLKSVSAARDVKPAPPKGGSSAKTIGKVFFLFNGKEFWCSASAVAAKNKSVVATAGHCAYDPRLPGAAENWIFVPNPAADGSTPDGIYVGANLSLHEDWAGKGDYDFDYAFVTVHRGFVWDKQKDGTFAMKDVGKLQDKVGGQGLAIGKGHGQRINAFGYPAGAQPDGSRPFDGRTLEPCQGSTSKTTAPSRELEHGVLLQPCNLTAGASGGPWLWKYSSSSKLGYLNGVNSLTWNRDARGAYDAVSAPPFITTTSDVYRHADAQATVEK